MTVHPSTFSNGHHHDGGKLLAHHRSRGHHHAYRYMRNRSYGRVSPSAAAVQEQFLPPATHYQQQPPMYEQQQPCQQPYYYHPCYYHPAASTENIPPMYHHYSNMMPYHSPPVYPVAVDTTPSEQPVSSSPSSPRRRRVPTTFTFRDQQQQQQRQQSYYCNAGWDPAISTDEEDAHSVDHSEEDDSLPSLEDEAKGRRKVQFATSVDVREIPNRRSYSDEIKQALWNSRKQIRRAACRNAFEYSYEGHNWRNAVEEEDFLPLCGGKQHQQQWIHPAHHRYWEKQQRQRVKRQEAAVIRARSQFRSIDQSGQKKQTEPAAAEHASPCPSSS